MRYVCVRTHMCKYTPTRETTIEWQLIVGVLIGEEELYVSLTPYGRINLYKRFG